MAGLRIVVLEGDQTGQELLEQALRVIDPDVIGLDLELERFDLSLENRRATKNAVCTEAATAMARPGFGIKAATITPEGADDVGSPNRLIREAIDGKVIVRTGRRIPGIIPSPGSTIRSRWCGWRSRTPTAPRSRAGPRTATRSPAHRGDPPLHLPGGGRVRLPDRPGDRGPCLRGAEVDGQPRLRGDAERGDGRGGRTAPDVGYEPLLIDATYAGLLTGRADAPLVIPTSTATATCSRISSCLSTGRSPGPSRFCSRWTRTCVFGRDERGASRDGAGAGGQGHRQPDGDDPGRGGGPALRRRGGVEGAEGLRAVYDAVMETAASGIRTPDLKGHAGTTEFTDAVIERVRGLR